MQFLYYSVIFAMPMKHKGIVEFIQIKRLNKSSLFNH